ncbi:unnamed protein product, partial [Ectocarpus fasciculatus]
QHKRRSRHQTTTWRKGQGVSLASLHQKQHHHPHGHHQQRQCHRHRLHQPRQARHHQPRQGSRALPPSPPGFLQWRDPLRLPLAGRFPLQRRHRRHGATHRGASFDRPRSRRH